MGESAGPNRMLGWLLRHFPGCRFHGIDDLLIAGAAAKITAHSLTDLLPCRFCVAPEEVRCREDHAGRAEAALDGSVLDKGFLQGMEFFSERNPFDGGDTTTFELGGQHQTRECALAVDKDGACTAFPCAASFLCPCKVQILPEQVDDPPISGRLDPNRFSI